MKLLYPATITFNEDDDGYLVEFIDLPGCITDGDTLEEAATNGREALTAFLSSMYDRNLPIPEPSTASQENVYLIEPEPDVAVPVMLKRLRENSKLTQSDVAKVLGISYQAYQRLEKPGKSNPTLKTLERLARVYRKQVHLELT
jgi:antitoxin HicB